MKTITYNDKITIHIPHFKWSDDQLIPVDFEKFEDILEEKLKAFISDRRSVIIRDVDLMRIC